MNISISICPTSLQFACGDTYNEQKLLAAIRSFIEQRHPGATITCLQIGHRQRQGEQWAIIDGSYDDGDDLLEEFYQRHGADEELFVPQDPVYRIERCRSHQTHDVPREWETVFSGTEEDAVAQWWGNYAGTQASGDQYRLVDADGVEQIVGEADCVGPAD